MSVDKDVLDLLIAKDDIKNAVNDNIYIGWIDSDAPIPAIRVNLVDSTPINTLKGTSGNYTEIRVNIWAEGIANRQSLVDLVQAELNDKYSLQFTEYIQEADGVYHSILSYLE